MDATIDGVRVAGTAQGPVPVVVLAIEDHTDILPIFIGFAEARSIAHGLDATDIGRPLTYDLTLDLIEALGGRVNEIAITEVTDDGTFIADLHLQTPRGTTVVDARPSDSLALAARTNAPITVSEAVFESGRRAADTFRELEDIREIGNEPPHGDETL